jgi:carbon storage regulator
MLVLSRKVSESILIGDDIAITVVRIGPGTVRLGITAPREVNTARDELVRTPSIVSEFVEPPLPAEAVVDVEDSDLGGEGGGCR